MSQRPPVTLADRHRFDAVIDVRSPAEFADDHLPGAINLPVLDDQERRIIGTLYKQQGAFEARRLGAAMVAANLSRHLRGPLAHRPANWSPLVYCWRGGMRSGSAVHWLRLIGWDAQQLPGGYKRWRSHVIAQIDALTPRLDLRMVCGATGSGKTRLLQALAARGAQVIDLEALACHKGSLLGALPGRPQPSQRGFESALFSVLEGLRSDQPVFVEAESRRIGRIALPSVLLEAMREAPCIEVQATDAARLQYLLQDYAYLGDDLPALQQRLLAMRDAHSQATLAQWLAWAQARDFAPLFAALMREHYDPQYARSQAQHYRRWPERQALVTDNLDAAHLAALAAQLWP